MHCDVTFHGLGQGWKKNYLQFYMKSSKKVTMQDSPTETISRTKKKIYCKKEFAAAPALCCVGFDKGGALGHQTCVTLTHFWTFEQIVWPRFRSGKQTVVHRHLQSEDSWMNEDCFVQVDLFLLKTCHLHTQECLQLSLGVREGDQISYPGLDKK